MATPSVLRDVVEQHAEEAAFLWCLRDAATDHGDYTLRDLADLEDRIEAHLDGLRVAGEPGREVVWEHLERYQGPGELFVATTLALESRLDSRIDAALEFAEAGVDARRGFFGALGWVPPEALRGRVVAWLKAPTSFRRLAGVVACSAHRADPGAGLEALLEDDTIVRSRALRLVAEIGRLDLRQRVHRALAEQSDSAQFWAAWTAGLLGERASTVPVLQRWAVSDSPIKWRALDLVIRLMGRSMAITWLRDLGADPTLLRLIIVGTGVLGDPAAVPWLLQRMTDPVHRRAAGESFSLITGVRLSRENLDGPPPEDPAFEPLDSADSDSVVADDQENLPWPAPTKVAAWWEAEAGRFVAGVRHLLGRPLDEAACQAALRDGNQRERRAAAYELVLLHPGRHVWNWRARASAQAAKLLQLEST